MKAKSIVIDNVTKKEEAERKIAVLKKITENNFHNFKFEYGPIGGSLNIYLSSDYDFDNEDDDTSPEMQMLTAFNFAIMCKL